jgi:hypothetical protein
MSPSVKTVRIRSVIIDLLSICITSPGITANVLRLSVWPAGHIIDR